jgi:hypothetical protein
MFEAIDYQSVAAVLPVSNGTNKPHSGDRFGSVGF